jgi:hypothetical protein
MYNNFEVGGIVSLKGNDTELFKVVGVIHDSGRLFLKDYANTLSEFEVKFDDVKFYWQRIQRPSSPAAGGDPVEDIVALLEDAKWKIVKEE